MTISFGQGPVIKNTSWACLADSSYDEVLKFLRKFWYWRCSSLFQRMSEESGTVSIIRYQTCVWKFTSSVNVRIFSRYVLYKRHLIDKISFRLHFTYSISLMLLANKLSGLAEKFHFRHSIYNMAFSHDLRVQKLTFFKSYES